MFDKLKYATLLLSFLCLSACKQSLAMKTEADIPAPLSHQYPLAIGVVYEDDLKNYVYAENSEDRANWNISVGDAQIELFNQIIPPLFTKVDVINTKHADKYDAFFTPKLVDIQFALPVETQIDFYEVWVKYNIHIDDPKGDTILILPFSGYGKSKTKFFSNSKKGLQAAANQAYRAAGANFILQFESHPKIKQWIADNI